MIAKDCPHCDATGFAFRHALEETANFRIVCDVHPLMEGHLLIIPKEHISCAGEFTEKTFKEFLELHERCRNFLRKAYGSVSAFEHGKLGQTVFHAHVHLLPCAPDPMKIIPEGKHHLTAIDGMQALPEIFRKDGGYLFFSINDQSWIVDPRLGKPRFFRDRFAKILGVPERGNWKEIRENPSLMKSAEEEIAPVEKRWRRH